MPVVEDVLAHRLISEVGDINKWHNKKLYCDFFSTV